MPENGIKRKAPGFLLLIVPAAFIIVFVSSTWRFLLALGLVAIAFNVWQLYEWRKTAQRIDPIFQREILANQGSITPLDLSLKSSVSARDAEHYLEDKAREFAAQKRSFEDRGTVYYFLTVKTLGTLFDESEPLAEKLPAAPQAPTRLDAIESEESTSSKLEEPTGAQTSPVAPPSENATPEAEPELNMVAMPPIAGSFTQDTDKSSEAESNPVPDPWQPEPQVPALKPLIQAELAKRLDVSASTVFKRREEPDFREWTMGRDPDGIAWEYSPKTKDFRPVEQA